MGELIEFKKGAGNVWDDAGEAFPDEDSSNSPKPRLLIIPILVFLDGFSLVLAMFCRPVAATLPIAGGAAAWAILRDVLGFGVSWASALCLGAWLAAHFFGRDIDQLIKAVETGESALMRAAARRHAALGRAAHLALYLYVAAAPFGLAAWLGGGKTIPLACAALPAVVAVTTRYYWHPVARHATLLGGKRKFTVAAGTSAAE
jgi:hypothetical protein